MNYYSLAVPVVMDRVYNPKILLLYCIVVHPTFFITDSVVKSH